MSAPSISFTTFTIYCYFFGENMALREITAVLLVSILLLSGCLTGNDESTEEVTEPEIVPDNPNPSLYEGDDPGECSDGADNDQDGLFDCNDPNCSGSPSCQAANDNNTQNNTNSTETGQNGTNPDDNNTQPGENSTEPGNETEELGEWQIVNLTDNMILAGDLDATDCGLLFVKTEWDPSAISTEGVFRSIIGDAALPVVDFWVANVQDSAANNQLPSLYDWRNGAIDTERSGTLYLIDDDEVHVVDTISGNADLGTVCIPSQRDSIRGLFEVVSPAPVPFEWTATTMSTGDVQNLYDNYSTGGVCDVILLSSQAIPQNTVEFLHDIHVSAFEQVGETDINFWIANTTGENDQYLLDNLIDWVNQSLGFYPVRATGGVGNYLIVDGNGLSFINSYESIPRDACYENSRQDVFKFFNAADYTPRFTSVGNLVYLANEGNLEWYLNATSETLTPYEIAEVSNQGWHGIYTDLELECAADLDENLYPYQMLNKRWLLNGREILSETLNFTDEGAVVGDMVACNFDVYDPVANLTFIMPSKNMTLQERGPLVHSGNITVTNLLTEIIECQFEVINPNQSEFTAIYYWMIDTDGDGDFFDGDGYGDWFSAYSETGQFNPNDPDAGFSSVQVNGGQLIMCTVELHTANDAQILLEAFDAVASARKMSSSSVDWVIGTNTAPVINSVVIAAEYTADSQSNVIFNCTADATDNEGDQMTETYVWFKNGNKVQSGNSSTFTYPASSGDNVICEVEVDDGNLSTKVAHRTHYISISSGTFDTASLTISVGDSVNWVNTDATAHTSTGDQNEFDSGTLGKYDGFRFKFTSAGTYSYHCNFHTGMTATITVQ